MEEKPRLDRIEEKLDVLVEQKAQQKKPFWMPFKARVGKKKAEKGYTTVMVIRDNRNISFQKEKIEEQTLVVDEIPRIVTAEETLYYKGKPFVIVPSWSTKPFSPTDNYADTVKLAYASQGYRLLINRMKNEAISAKKKISGLVVFGVIIAVVVIGYLIMKGGAFK